MANQQEKEKIEKVIKQKLILGQKKTQIKNNETDVKVQNEVIIDSEDNEDDSVQILQKTKTRCLINQ